MVEKSKVRKVLIIDNSVGITGAFKSIQQASSNINNCKFYYAVGSSIVKSTFPANSNVRAFKFIEIQKSLKTLLYFPFLLKNAFSLYKWIRKEKIDIIHVNDMYNMIGVVLKMIIPSLRLIHHIRLLPTSYLGKFYRIFSFFIVNKADKLICVSKAVFESIPSTDKKLILYDAAKIDPRWDSMEETSPDQTTRFLYPANYISGKGQEYAIEAFKEVVKQHQNVYLKFVGSDMSMDKNADFKMKLKEQASGLDQSLIEFGDYSMDIFEEMSAHDVVLMFSESESFSMICLEAGLMGKPVIATKCGGPEEIIVNNETGYLVEVANVNEMKDLMIELASNSKKRINFGSNAKISCRDRFSLQKASRNLNLVYQSI